MAAVTFSEEGIVLSGRAYELLRFLTARDVGKPRARDVRPANIRRGAIRHLVAVGDTVTSTEELVQALDELRQVGLLVARLGVPLRLGPVTIWRGGRQTYRLTDKGRRLGQRELERPEQHRS